MASNPFIGLDSATLATLKSDFVACLSAIAKNQAYTLNGRSLTRANLAEVKQTLGEIQAAIDYTNGDSANVTFVSFTGQ